MIPGTLQSEEFDYLFYRDGIHWINWGIVRPHENLSEQIFTCRKENHMAAVVIIPHPPHYPLAATRYCDDGLKKYLHEWHLMMEQR